jgi:hypothetical protein
MALCSLVVAGFPAWGAPPGPRPGYSEEGQRIFRQSRGAVVQVRTLIADSNTQQSVGSGFVVSPDGLTITNYHVISSWITQPGQYRLEYVTDDGGHGPLEVLAIDVQHDLALLSRAGRNLPHLALEGAPLDKGETVFTIGNPRDIGLTLVEGTYNGLRDYALYDEIHFTGALNPGMSGGPAISRSGRVFGVNRSRYVSSQLISFLVPARHVQALLANRPARPPAHGEIMAEVIRQVRAHGENIIATVDAPVLPTIETQGYRLPYGLSPRMRCTGAAPTEDGSFYRKTFRTCLLNADVPPIDRIMTGTLQVSYVIIQKDELDAFRLARLRKWARHLTTPAEQFPYGDLTRYECRTEMVTANGTPLKALICLRGYQRLPGIYDVALRISSQTGRDTEFGALVALSGVPFEPAMAFLRHFLEGIKWIG